MNLGTASIGVGDSPAMKLISLGPALMEALARSVGRRFSSRLRQQLLALTIGTAYSAGAMAGWDHHEGKGYTLCDALHKRLNKYAYPDPVKHVNSCGWNVMLSYPGFTEPPWEELEPRQHEELIFKLLRYAEGSFARPGSEPRIRAEAREFIEQGGRVQLWRTRLISDFYNKKHPEVWAPPGVQNVIHLRYPPTPIQEETTALCPDVPRAGFAGGSLFIVNDEFTDIHPDMGVAGPILARSTLLLYRGRPHFLSGSFAFEFAVGRDEGSGPGSFCNFRYTHPIRRK